MMIDQSAPVPINAASAPFELSNKRDQNEPRISSLTLAHLNLGVFRQLRKLGTSKQRICTTLNLTPREFDYVSTLA